MLVMTDLEMIVMIQVAVTIMDINTVIQGLSIKFDGDDRDELGVDNRVVMIRMVIIVTVVGVVSVCVGAVTRT